MNCAIINEKIKILLDETSTSFKLLIESGGSHNMDFADYVSRFSIHKFRSALQNPDLSRAALAAMLRRGERTTKEQDSHRGTGDYWSSFMASYVQKSANTNDIVAQ